MVKNHQDRLSTSGAVKRQLIVINFINQSFNSSENTAVVIGEVQDYTNRIARGGDALESNWKLKRKFIKSFSMNLLCHQVLLILPYFCPPAFNQS